MGGDRYLGVVSELSGTATRDERRPDVERRLISAVTALCADGTAFGTLSMSRIVREAGLGRATFYLYFADRSAFVLRLVDHVRDQLMASVSASWRSADDQESLTRALAEFVEVYHREFPLITAVVDAGAGDVVVAEALENRIQGFITESAQVIEAAQAGGVVRPELPARETASALVWMVERTCYRMAGSGDSGARARLADALAMIAWHSLHP